MNSGHWAGSNLTTMSAGGEAHFWSGRLGGVCVDLGYTRTGTEMVVRKPRVVVLTHSDGDHINGARPFFEAQSCELAGSPTPELWAPYEWSVLVDVFHQVVGDGVTDERIRQTEEYAEPLVSLYDDADTREEPNRLGDPSPRTPVPWPDANPFVPEAEDPDEERAEPERDDVSRVAAALAAGAATGTIRARVSLTDSDISKIANDIARKATRLQKVLAAAADAGWIIRWFSADHKRSDNWQKSGKPGFVTISNAQEVRVRRAQASAALLLHAAQLTIQNQRALAPYLWGSPDGHDAIVWSDGDGGGARHLKDFPWSRIGLMSAPHHGSHMSAHDPIWNSLHASEKEPDIVRTGGFSSQTVRPVLWLLPLRRSRATHKGPGHQLGDVVWHEWIGFRS